MISVVGNLAFTMMILVLVNVSSSTIVKRQYVSGEMARENGVAAHDIAENGTSALLDFSTSRILIVIQTVEPVVFDYQIPCENENQTFFVKFKSKSERVFSVVGNKVIELPCGTTEEANATNATGEYINKHMTLVNGSFQVILKGNELGITQLHLTAYKSGENIPIESVPAVSMSKELTKNFTVSVLKERGKDNEVFRYIVAFVLIVLSMGFGCALDLGIVKESVKKPIALLIGFSCQYALMPLVSIN